MLDKNKKVLIIGLGLIGGSYAAALSGAGYEVGAIDCRADAIGYALEHGFIRHGMTKPDGAYIGSADIVVFALYPHTMLDFAAKSAKYIKRGALVTDVTGVKSGIVAPMQAMMPEGVEFVGAHPMAGR